MAVWSYASPRRLSCSPIRRDIASQVTSLLILTVTTRLEGEASLWEQVFRIPEANMFLAMRISHKGFSWEPVSWWVSLWAWNWACRTLLPPSPRRTWALVQAKAVLSHRKLAHQVRLITGEITKRNSRGASARSVGRLRVTCPSSDGIFGAGQILFSVLKKFGS